MLFNESCKTGRLQVDARTVKVVSGKRVVWSTPRSRITYIAVKKGMLLADLTIYTSDHHYPAQFLTRKQAQKFLALFPGVPHGHAPSAAQPPSYVPSPMTHNPQWNATPTVPFHVPPPQPAKKKPPLWAYVVVIILVLGLCGGIGSAVVNAVSNNSSQQTQIVPTPTNTPDTSQSSTLDATVTASVPTQAPVPTKTPTPKPTVKPTAKPVPTRPPAPTPTSAPSCNGINGNPWCYNFSLGTLIYNPPSNFCSYFNCISSFWEPDDPGDGYVIQCQDGTYSQSGGERGACSYHGGEMRPLYAH